MNKSNNYLVILTIVTGLMGCYFIFKIDTLLFVALGVAIVSILSSYLAEKIVWIWDKIALVLGTINSKILLSVIFYIFVVPIALISRVFKKGNALLLKKQNESYYKVRDHLYTKKDLEEVF